LAPRVPSAETAALTHRIIHSLAEAIPILREFARVDCASAR
jgi:hypothetical protein